MTADVDPEYEKLLEEQLSDPTIPDAEEVPFTPDTVRWSPYAGMEVLFPNRAGAPGSGDSGAIGKVVGRKRNIHGNPKGTANSNPGPP